MDFATRAHNHSFHIDPVLRTLTDDDFYKFAMHQFIGQRYPKVKVTFGQTNRTKSIRIADEVPIEAIRDHFDYARTLRFTTSELAWLRGQSFYGQRRVFGEDYIDSIATYQLPEYELSVNKETGQYDIHFPGNWFDTTMWEIHSLTIVNELRYRAIMSKMSKSELDIMYSKAKVRLYDKLIALRNAGVQNITDFGTRRRHSFLWQEYAVMMAKDILGDAFTGTSNVHLAMKHDLEAKGTNAHELPMVLAALAESDEELKGSQYRVLKEWAETYNGGMLVFLPDTFGTSQFLDGAPDWVADWTGGRPDSKRPEMAGRELHGFWRTHGRDPKSKLVIFSDGLDVDIPGHRVQSWADIPTIWSDFKNMIRPGFGWGTGFTNDFLGCHPVHPDLMKSISLVCKAVTANGRSCVKLSDNPSKAIGEPDQVERYLRVFGDAGRHITPVIY